MKGAIFFSGQYGSTEQYAQWIAQETGLPVFDANQSRQDPADFDFLIVGSSVIIYKLTIRHWIETNYAVIKNKPILVYTVSGASAGPKLDAWIAESLPAGLVATMHHVALGGRQDPKQLNWWTRLILIIGGLMNRDPKARKEEMEGFDFVDRTAIEPIVEWVKQQANTPPAGKV